ncbi:hypothetical protein [uncultured Hoeflea sp.]|uniref:hypothetical protein n=1 Tax=uncultured Hoeflea sp. TaxID=538666 RepID=UPI0030DD4FDF
MTAPSDPRHAAPLPAGALASAGVTAPVEAGREHSAGATRSLAANTLIMALRTILTMAVSLYSSRIVLAELGVVDYGIYFSVAGVTLLLSFLNSALATSTQRFLSVEIGRRDDEQLRTVFGASLQIHLAIALVTLLASESLGLWFIDAHMVIPEPRMDAARLAFHFAVFSTVLTIIQVPYNAALVSHERFTVYAAFDVLHAVLRLAVAVMLMLSSGDRLELFAALMFGVTLFVMAVKALYCRMAFACSRLRLCRDRALLRNMSGFAGWSILGAASLVLNIQGVGILLNIFFGPVANAAQTVALQLSNATSTLASNLQIVSSPQIIKAHAGGDRDGFHRLIERSARLSFMLMLVLMAPMIIGADLVLGVWLRVVPDHAGGIARLLLLAALVNSFSFPLMTAAQATGTIRTYQALVGGLMLSAIPLGYLMLFHGAGVLSVFQLLLALSVLALGVRLLVLRSLIGLDVARFLRSIVLPGAMIGAMALFSGLAVRLLCPVTLPAELAAMATTALATALAVWFLGMSAAERAGLKQAVTRRFNPGGKRP